MDNLNYLGEIAGLTTALLWATTAIFFTAAGVRIGSQIVNLLRLTLALPLLTVTLLLTRGADFSLWFRGGKPWLLVLSGVIGLVIGDGALFKAFVLGGPHRSMLVMTLVPILTALFAWDYLGEALPLLDWVGIIVTVSGIVWVVLERRTGRFTPAGMKALQWLGLAVLGAACQAVGLVFAKDGMGGEMKPLDAALIRMASAAASLWIITLVTPLRRRLGRAIKDSRGMLLTCCGSITGPYLGVWLSLVTVKLIPAGVAATMMATVPIWVMPLARIAFGERSSPRAIFGTLIVVGGVVLLFLT